MLPPARCINKICENLIFCFAGCCVALLGYLVLWIWRCRSRKSFLIGNSSKLFHTSSWLETMVCRVLTRIFEICCLCRNLRRERWVVKTLNSFLQKNDRQLAAMLTIRARWFNALAGGRNLETANNVPRTLRIWFLVQSITCICFYQ